jgi:dTDP-4-amino-4,6-dideoxygalactose transaminase
MISHEKKISVPLANPAADLKPIRREIDQAITKILDNGAYILGPAVAAFEEEMVGHLGVAAAIGVGSGTDALVLALLGVGVGVGDEVITVSHTAGATVAAIRMIGAIPVLVDIEPDTYCIDPTLLEAARGPRLKAVVAVHLYGHPADMQSIMQFGARHGIAIIEDCAQSQEAMIDGRRVGSMGDVGCFSFYPTKNLGAIGDGGMVIARDRAIGDRVRQLRTYGWSQPQFATMANGRCSRLDSIQAAILAVKLRYLVDQVERRRAIAQRYNEAFADLPLTLPLEKPGFRHARHLYVIRSDEREDLMAHLDRSGVAHGLHYPYPVHAQPGLAAGARIPAELHVTNSIIPKILTLPLFPGMSDQQVTHVIASVQSFFGRS